MTYFKYKKERKNLKALWFKADANVIITNDMITKYIKAANDLGYHYNDILSTRIDINIVKNIYIQDNDFQLALMEAKRTDYREIKYFLDLIYLLRNNATLLFLVSFRNIEARKRDYIKEQLDFLDKNWKIARLLIE